MPILNKISWKTLWVTFFILILLKILVYLFTSTGF
jgi:hypothetical protein